MSNRKIDPKLLEKVKKAREELARKGRNYDGLGDALDKEEKIEGPDFGPRNDIEYQKLLREIRSLDDK